MNDIKKTLTTLGIQTKRADGTYKTLLEVLIELEEAWKKIDESKVNM
jgi:hypothetical protein